MNTIASHQDWRTLADLSLPGAPGDEWAAMDQVAQAIRGFNLSAECQDRLKGAIARAARGMIGRAGCPADGKEPGRPRPPITIRVLALPRGPAQSGHAPGGDWLCRGWRFFMVQKVAEAGRVDDRQRSPTISIYLYQE